MSRRRTEEFDFHCQYGLNQLSVTLFKRMIMVQFPFPPLKGFSFLGEFVPVPTGGFRDRGRRVCTDCKAPGGKFVISDFGQKKHQRLRRLLGGKTDVR